MVKWLMLLVVVYFVTKILLRTFKKYWFNKYKEEVVEYWSKMEEGVIYRVRYPWGTEEYFVVRIAPEKKMMGRFRTPDLKKYLEEYFRGCTNYTLI